MRDNEENGKPRGEANKNGTGFRGQMLPTRGLCCTSETESQ